MGMYSYYSKWIPSYSELTYPLSHCTSFPLTSTAISSFCAAKIAIERAVLTTIDEDVSFMVETYASHHAIDATLNQAGRPVAFFSRILSCTE